MKKFVFLYYGFEPTTQEIREAWGNWFESVGDKIVDSGNPFGSGREITHHGSRELSLDSGAPDSGAPDSRTITGYSIFNAESIDEAEEIAKGCPMVTSVRVYEAVSM